MKAHIELLGEENFERLTEWHMREDKLKPVELSWPKTGCNLYSFVVNDETVKYIGLTTMVLISRLDHYSYGRDSTNHIARMRLFPSSRP